MTNQVATQQVQAPLDVSDKSIFSNVEKFQQVKYMAEYLAESNMVPTQYQKNAPNVLIALSMAERIQADPMMVMQNLTIIHGRPSWSSQFLISCVNTCGRFTALQYEEEEGVDTEVEYTIWKNKQPTTKQETIKNDRCRAYATELATGKVVHGPWVSVEMAVKEGWYSKSGSKWQTMPALMLQYRSAAFFVRTKAPEISMGMHTEDEVRDMGEAVVVNDTDEAEPVMSEAQDLLNSMKKPEKKKEPESEVVDAEFDIVKFMKMSIDSCATLEDLKQCGQDIADKKESGELDEDQVKEVKAYYKNVKTAMENQPAE